MVALSADGRMFWNGEPIEFMELRRRATAQARKVPDIKVYLGADPDTKYADVMEVLMTLQRSGLVNAKLDG